MSLTTEEQYVEVVKANADETFKVGHRMQGNQKWQNDDKRKRKYVGSEVFAEDVLEKICENVYAKSHTMLEEFSGDKYSSPQTQKLRESLFLFADCWPLFLSEKHPFI